MTTVTTYNFRLTGISSLMFGKHIEEARNSDETHSQFDQRTWKLKVNERNGQCCINPFAIKNSLESAASRLSMKIGAGRGTFTKLFKQGVMVVDWLMLEKPGGKPLMVDDVQPLPLFVPADGKRGSGTRVTRVFPVVHEWESDVSVMVLDGRITEEVLMRHLVEAGGFIGVGSMRVENGGINGRFSVEPA